MRLKTVGVILLLIMGLFTAAYWLTDEARRTALGDRHEEELLPLGEVIFSESATDARAAGCARCHGPQGEGGPIPNDPSGRTAPSLHTTSLADKLRANPNYVHLVVSYGGVVVSGNVRSPMPAWSAEVGGPLNEQQLEAVVNLVESWAEEAAANPPEEVEDTAEAGAQVYVSAGCQGCHGPALEGTGSGPNIQGINSAVITDLPVEPSQLDQMIADYAEDPRAFLELWIRDSAVNYNDGAPTGMPAHPVATLPDSQLQALITFLLEQNEGLVN
ncbi:MAG: c-type cytochrome [Candidatus Limnocylindria bacterium]